MNLPRRVRSLIALAGALSLGAAVTGVSTAAAAVRPRVTMSRSVAAERTAEAGHGSDTLVRTDVRTIGDRTFQVARVVTGTGDGRRVVFTALDLRTGRRYALNEPR
jgi:hypothetical protein